MLTQWAQLYIRQQLAVAFLATLTFVSTLSVTKQATDTVVIERESDTSPSLGRLNLRDSLKTSNENPVGEFLRKEKSV